MTHEATKASKEGFEFSRESQQTSIRSSKAADLFLRKSIPFGRFFRSYCVKFSVLLISPKSDFFSQDQKAEIKKPYHRPAADCLG